MLNKLAKFFPGTPRSPAIAQEPQSDSHPAAAQTGSAKLLDIPQKKPLAPAKVSLLKRCDQKLDELAKFFTGEQEPPAILQEPQSDTPAAEAQADAATVAESPQESAVPDNVSLLEACDRKLAEWSSFFSGAQKSPADATMLSASPETGNTDSMPQLAFPENREAPAGTQEPQFDLEPAEVQADFGEMPKPPRHQGLKSEVQLQMLEHLLEREITLERQINKINNAVTGLSDVFRDELQRQIAASAHSYEQQLLDSKNTLEITLKSAFKKMADRQTALEDNHNQHIDLMQQVFESNQEGIADAIAKLDNLTEQIRRLTENVLQLTKNSEAQQFKINIDALAARVAALEKPPKRKSWFGK
jgi:uncharacterized phage infection (PIP) family protein YhgE